MLVQFDEITEGHRRFHLFSYSNWIKTQNIVNFGNN
jgi:hypothetical protein